MKNYFYKTLAALSLFICTTGSLVFAQTLNTDSVLMGPGYANEIYYSTANGEVASVARDQWDIAFRTMIMSSSIIINDGAGVVLYTYPSADTSSWAAIDTTGLSSWTKMFNDPDEWEFGAFNRNAGIHPDYGWGKYNDQTHNIVGDSIYIIKLRDGSFKKIWIKVKKSALDIYEFRYANLDGTSEQNVSLNLLTHMDVDFYGYDLKNNAEVNFQPVKSSWDILFTRYVGINTGQPYPVMGVLSNGYLNVKEFSEVPQTFNEWWTGEWDTTRSVIGYDWKTFNSSTFSFVVNDSLVYFIADPAGDIYKLYFTKFEGSSTGKIVFNIGKISSLGVGDKKGASNLTIYPNPVVNRLTLSYEGSKFGDRISVINISGQTVITTINSLSNSVSIDVASLPAGIYFINVTSSNNSFSKKFIISR